MIRKAAVLLPLLLALALFAAACGGSDAGSEGSSSASEETATTEAETTEETAAEEGDGEEATSADTQLRLWLNGSDTPDELVEFVADTTGLRSVTVVGTDVDDRTVHLLRE